MAPNLSKLINCFLFTPVLAAVPSALFIFLFNVFCAKQRPPWITNDLMGDIDCLNAIGLLLLCPIFIVISVVVLIKRKNQRRIVVAALVANVLAIAYFLIGPALLPSSKGAIYDIGTNKSDFKFYTEGCELDSNFTTVESVNDLAWDGGWICYRCQYSDTAALRSWLKTNGLKQTQLYNTDRVSVDDLLPYFGERRPSWLPVHIGKMEFFQKQLLKNIGNNIAKKIDIQGLLDTKNKVLYVHIDKRCAREKSARDLSDL